MGAGKETSSDALNKDIELQSPSEINATNPESKEKKEEAVVQVDKKDPMLDRYDLENNAESDDEEIGDAVKDAQEEELIRKRKITPKRVWELIVDAWGTLLFTLIWTIFLIVGGVVLWPELTWKAWFSLVVCFTIVTVLMKEWFQPHIVLIFAMVSLMVSGVITPAQALAGFSNDGLMTIVVLYVIAKALEVTHAVDYLTRYVMRTPTKLWDAQLRLGIPTIILSAFTNNTPQVAVMIPALENWCTKIGMARSKFMLPLSFYSVMGGVLSIIGTSTNIIVKGTIEKDNPDLKIGFFDVGAVGLPVSVAGLIYLVIGSYYLLPDRKSLTEKYLENPREYSVSLVVTKKSHVVNQSIATAGLRNLHGAFLFRIERQNETISAPDPETVLKEGDVLFFAGSSESMTELLKFEGLELPLAQADKVVGKKKYRFLVEVVISSKSPLIGKTVLESQFRKKYNAAIIAAHHGGIRIEGNIADHVLQSGDTLLIESGKSFIKYHKHDPDFALVNQLTTTNVRKRVPLWKTWFTVLVTTAMIIVTSFDTIPLITSSFVTACVLITFKCVSVKEAGESINGEIIVLVAAVFGIGTALDKTGAARAISGTLFGALAKVGRLPLLAGIYIFTVLLTAVFSNGGTVILMYTLGKRYIQEGTLTEYGLAYALMLAGSCSFLTPIGYQTDLMVMGPGGYTVMDYVRLGVPLTILCSVVAIIVTHFAFNLP